MRWRAVRLLMGGFLAAALIVPSGVGWFAPKANAAGPVTLNFLATDFPEYDAFVAAANEIGRPMGIEVKKTNVNFDDMQKKALLDYTSGVKTWDLIFVNSAWTPSFAARKLLVPIDDFFTTGDAKAMVKASDFVPATKQLTSNGKLYSMPYLSAPLMVGYRKDLFSDASERHAFKAKYGYDLAPPRTYKALLDIARFFTRRKGQTLAGKPLDEDFYGTVVASKKGFVFSRYMDMLVGFGANLLYDAKTMRPSWNSPESVSALKYYVDLYKTMPADAQTMTGGMSARFAAGGRSATIVHFLDLMYSSFEDPKASKVVGKFGYVLLPTQVASRPHATAADANGIGVYALSEHKAEAFKLLANTLSADGIKAAVLKYYPEFPSMRRSILNDPQVIRTRPALYRAMGLITSEKVYLFALPEIKEWAQLVDVASDSILEAATGQKSVEQAASEGQNRMVDIFKRAGYIK